MKVTRVHFKQLCFRKKKTLVLQDEGEHMTTTTCKLIKATGLMAPVELSRVESLDTYFKQVKY